ncbi:hypothetical protein CYMTET_41850 [Cymbomonas tetramitiformis]|uniref:Uncharacterized protein n=1 Tax=Cymbomonas tetramitiformis TaxID=36881 RepID=A0AAE0C6L0_9CHLO|nr:hypothetical protein CYMTET_41850 [Cymbomonas tetramitiformis]
MSALVLRIPYSNFPSSVGLILTMSETDTNPTVSGGKHVKVNGVENAYSLCLSVADPHSSGFQNTQLRLEFFFRGKNSLA